MIMLRTFCKIQAWHEQGWILLFYFFFFVLLQHFSTNIPANPKTLSRADVPLEERGAVWTTIRTQLWQLVEKLTSSLLKSPDARALQLDQFRNLIARCDELVQYGKEFQVSSFPLPSYRIRKRYTYILNN